LFLQHVQFIYKAWDFIVFYWHLIFKSWPLLTQSLIKTRLWDIGSFILWDLVLEKLKFLLKLICLAHVDFFKVVDLTFELFSYLIYGLIMFLLHILLDIFNFLGKIKEFLFFFDQLQIYTLLGVIKLMFELFVLILYFWSIFLKIFVQLFFKSIFELNIKIFLQNFCFFFQKFNLCNLLILNFEHFFSL
jgi:hypothetical protein